ncbi:MAG TPA: CHAT domain-containing protein [Ramlibacter sp.]|nr:CHAT domain-containing protein [Ramlibacter sp.]
MGFKGMGSAAAWDADSFPDLHAADGAGPAIESICGMFTLFDHYVDLTGLSSALGPADDVRELGLPEHPLVAGREELLRAFDADSMLRMIVPLMLQAPRRPPVVQVALCAGPMMCMVLRMIGYHELAYYLNLCLDTVARLRGPSSLPRAELALQRGFFLLADRQDAAARICFAFARRQVLAEGVPWRGELAQAMLGLALVDHRAGKVQAARIRLWRAYLMSLVVSESVAHTWRCANALSAVVARAAAPTAAAARQGRLASLLIDKLSVGQMLAHVGRHSATSVGKNGQWFPALRQAIATLVGLGRLAEAEMVRDMARSAQADRLSRRPRQVDERDFPSLLSGPERRAWQASGLQEMDAQVERLRSLVAGQRLVSAANGRHTSVGTTAELAALWRSLPLAMDASLARAAALLDDGDQESASATVSAMPPAHVNPGCALLGYLVLPDEFVVSLVLPGGTRFEHRVPVGEKELWGLVFRLRSACADAQAPLEHVQSEASRAYALLLGPLRDALEAAGTRQVDVAPHEFLDQVPFAALWDGRQFMVERFAWCVRHPGASPTGDRANAPLGRMRRLQLLGAQDFGHAAAPLGGVRRELARIRADAGPEARVWMDRDMTAAALVTALSDAETDGVHIATHAKFDPIDETRSVLLMGSGETVGIQEIRLRIVDRPVQLLVLAACSTAIKAPARDSIASAFLRAGVRAVLAAQWPVDDASAAWLMPLFYRALRRGEGLPPAQALQAAQLMFMHGDLAGEQWGDEAVDENQPTALDRRHPRLWSPYTLFV